MADGASTFLGLPLELREIIYKEALLQPEEVPRVLQACRQIYTEAYKFQFQRPLRFRSQLALYDWLDKAPHRLIEHVEDIDIELQDVDLQSSWPPAASFSTCRKDPSSQLHSWDVYEREVARLSSAFWQFRNIKNLTLRVIPTQQSRLYQENIEKVLNSLTTIYPTLQSLSLVGNFHQYRLDFLRAFKHLKGFSFDGFSASEATETAEILSNLQLTHLSLISQRQVLTPMRRQHSLFTEKPQSLNDQVLQTLHHLASLSVTEYNAESLPTLFFTPEILHSLNEHQTLSSLSIFLSHTPNPKTFVALETFLEKSSSIAKLELDWPNLDSKVLETYALLSVSLESFWIRATSFLSAFDILWNILESKESGYIPRLGRVVLVRTAWATTVDEEEGAEMPTAAQAIEATSETADLVGAEKDPPIDNSDEGQSTEADDSDDSDEENVAMAKRQLNFLGVMVEWCTEGL